MVFQFFSSTHLPCSYSIFSNLVWSLLTRLYKTLLFSRVSSSHCYCETSFSFAGCVALPRDLTYSSITLSLAFVSQQKCALCMCSSLHCLLSCLCPQSFLQSHHLANYIHWLPAFLFRAVDLQNEVCRQLWATEPHCSAFKPGWEWSPVMCPTLGLEHSLLAAWILGASLAL